jgi:tetratricopeptide (TPR) repeat protein
MIPFRGNIDWASLRADLASSYNMLGNAHSEAGHAEDAITAYDRAIALHENAMWYRNKAGVLIDMGNLNEAEAAIKRARVLEPDAPRLAELEAALARAREAARDEDTA